MPVYCDWYNKSLNIIVMRFVGDWTLEENQAANNIVNSLAKQNTTRLDIVVDASESSYTLPVGSLWYWKQLIETRSLDIPHWHLSVYVINSDVMRAMTKEGFETSSVIRQHCRVAKNLPSALDIIRVDRTNDIIGTEVDS